MPVVESLEKRVRHMHIESPYLSPLIDFADGLKADRSMFDSSDLPKLASALADWTATTACYRELKAGESRQGLCMRVVNGLQKRRWHTMSSHVATYTRNMAGLDQEASAEKVSG